MRFLFKHDYGIHIFTFLTGNTYTISKTSFLKFEQCPKAYYFHVHLPFLRDKLTTDKKLTFQRGHEVGRLAQSLFPGGIDVTQHCEKAEECAEFTAKLITEETPVIYEATFIHNGVLVMVDILCRDESGFTAYEVKSSLKVSENFLKDAILQYYVVSHVLTDLKELYLVTLDASYVKRGVIEPRKLFKKRGVKAQAELNFSYINYQVDAANVIRDQNAIPNIPIGRQCFKPYQCDYFSICWKDTITDKSVFNLPLTDKGTLFDWHDSGLKNIEQIPDELIKKDSLVRIKNAFILNEPVINISNIAAFLSLVKQPIVAMDMEVWSPAIPQIEGTRPFEQIPFLVSFYDGSVFRNFFAGEGTDERKTFALELILMSEGYETILVYDKNLETGVVNALVSLFPDLSQPLNVIKQKLVDVFEVFLKVDYYHPGFKNNFSLKAVSAVLLNDVSYNVISSGLEAMSYYDQFLVSENPLEKETFKNELLQYCNTDTEATFKLYQFLVKKVS